MPFALFACAAVGFVLGVHRRLLGLVAVSAFVATSASIVLLARGSPLLGLIQTIGLLAVLQASYLVGALLRTYGGGPPRQRWIPFGFSAMPCADAR